MYIYFFLSCTSDYSYLVLLDKSGALDKRAIGIYLFKANNRNTKKRCEIS